MIAIEITPLITVFGGIAVVGATYWFTKKRELEAEIRKEKLEHYKDFASALSGIVKNETTTEAQRAFARSCNKLQLVAPQSVIKALHDYQEEIKIGHVIDQKRHDRLLAKLFIEMRRDIHIRPPDDTSTFEVRLWGSGCPPV